MLITILTAIFSIFDPITIHHGKIRFISMGTHLNIDFLVLLLKIVFSCVKMSSLALKKLKVGTNDVVYDPLTNFIKIVLYGLPPLIVLIRSKRTT